MIDWTKNLLDMASTARGSELHDSKWVMCSGCERFTRPREIVDRKCRQCRENALLREALTEIEGSSEPTDEPQAKGMAQIARKALSTVRGIQMSDFQIQDDYSPAALIHWLRAKHRRYGEIEDEKAADEIERLQSQLDKIIGERDEEISRWIAADREKDDAYKELQQQELSTAFYADKARALETRLEHFRKALESIAKNTCCDKCQEAALVARKELAP